MSTIKTFGRVDERSLKQLERCMEAGDAEFGVLCADRRPGALGGVETIMREIVGRISFGMGVPAQERVDHPVLDKIRHAELAPQRKLVQLAESQLGTFGSGNHLLGDPEGLHPGPSGPGGLRGRLDGRRVGHPRGVDRGGS